MNLWETLKKPFLSNTKDVEQTSSPAPDTVISDLTDIYPTTMSFFDGGNNQSDLGLFGGNEKVNLVERQKQKIQLYRNTAKNPDVSDAIDEIVNEVSYVLNDEIPVEVSVDIDNEKIEKKISESFDKVNSLMNTRRTFFQVVKNAYIDGQLILHLSYNKDKLSEGITGVKILEPCYFIWDASREVYRYDTKNTTFFQNTGLTPELEFSKEEIVKVDFGLYEDGITLSYIDSAIKTSNQLKALEDLLIPLRFSRSISRRVFNVDVGDLPNGKAEEAMRQQQAKFKYKKFYNAETGEVTNQQHIMSMVEDYWFSNRSGGKGTQVDVLDESGNLGELDDIIYFYKKLYKSMKIPSNRIPNVDNDTTFDYDTTQVSKEDMKFFIFVSRLRQVFADMFKMVLMRELISTGALTEKDYKDMSGDIRVFFKNENAFIEKMMNAKLLEQIETWTAAQEHIGKLFSVEDLYMRIFKMSPTEVEETLKKIDKESNNATYVKFYKSEDDM